LNLLTRWFNLDFANIHHDLIRFDTACQLLYVFSSHNISDSSLRILKLSTNDQMTAELKYYSKAMR